MPRIREPAVAGRFYPADPAALRAWLQSCLARVPAVASGAACPRALIVPPAAYPGSGDVAAAAFARLREHRALIWRVVLLGASHHLSFEGLALTKAVRYRTPLGDVHLDVSTTHRLAALPGVRVLDAAHLSEHSLEVQLPFLQTVLGEFTLLPIVVGGSDPARVAELLESLGDDDGTVLVISADVSHGQGDAAPVPDRSPREAIQRLDEQAPGEDQAGGGVAVRGLLQYAARRRWKAVSLGHSDDSGGDQVAGCGAWAFDADPAQPGRLSTSDRDTLKSIAWASIRQGLAGAGPLTVRPEVYPPRLAAKGAVFVTLLKDGELRGCVGSLDARRPLVEDVAAHAWDAAFSDDRFAPLRPEELAELSMQICMLVPPETLDVHSDEELAAALRPGIDGVILEEGHRRATFLPSVWSQIPDPARFVHFLKRKGGWPDRYWSPALRVWRYEVEEF